MNLGFANMVWIDSIPPGISTETGIDQTIPGDVFRITETNYIDAAPPEIKQTVQEEQSKIPWWLIVATGVGMYMSVK